MDKYYYNKYLKYKSKYFILKGSGDDDSKKDDNKNKSSNITQEINDYKELFKGILTNNDGYIYIKGGSVIGLKIFNLLYKENNNLDLLKNYTDFIRDFDFIICVTEEKYKDFQELKENDSSEGNSKKKKSINSKKHNFIANNDKNNKFNREGTEIIVYRYNENRCMVGEQKNQEAYLEFSVKQCKDPNDNLNNSELPLTSMVIQLTIENLDKYFEFIEIFYKLQKNKENEVNEENKVNEEEIKKIYN